MTVYGAGRDQGMTSSPTVAIAAAVLGVPYEISFGGRTLFQYAEDVARTLILASRPPRRGARLQPRREQSSSTLGRGHRGRRARGAPVHHLRPTPLPFPSDIAHDRLAALGDVPVTPYREAIAATAAIFRDLAEEGRLIGSEQGIPSATGAGEYRHRTLAAGCTCGPRRTAVWLTIAPCAPTTNPSTRPAPVPADLLLAWTARLVEAVGNGLVLDGDGGSFKSGTHRRPAATSSLRWIDGGRRGEEAVGRAGLRRLGLDAR